MITLASVEEIEKFLRKTRLFIRENKICIIQRKKSMDTLNELGISIDDALAMIEEMKVENYYRGPSPERDSRFSPGEIWEFGIEFKDEPYYEEIYVKMKDETGNANIICLSFHKAEFPIVYPYKRDEGGEADGAVL